jgi:purine-binding chemotaxis protein CheW
MKPAAAPRPVLDWTEVHRRLRAAEARIQQGWSVNEAEKLRILEQRAAASAKKRGGEEAAGRQLELLEFTLAHERYAVELAHVGEVFPLKELTPLPSAPPFLLGIVNVRGRILPVLDLKKFFDLPDRGLSDMNKLLVLAREAMEVGILADTVVGLARLPVEILQAALPTLTGVRQDYLLGVGPERLAVLDAPKIVADPRLRMQAEPRFRKIEAER